MQVIASLELIAKPHEGDPFPVSLTLYLPELDTPPNTYACAIDIKPLYEKPFNIYGEGSLQALSLAARHGLQMLAIFISQHGTLAYPDGATFAPEHYGYQLLGNEPSAP